MADMWAKGRGATGDRRIAHRHPEIVQGERNGGAKLTEAQVRDIRRRVAVGERHIDLAGEYGVKAEAIGRIVRRTRWAHVA